MLTLQNVTNSRVFASQSNVYQIPEIHITALILRGDVSKESDKAKRKNTIPTSRGNEVLYLSGVSARGSLLRPVVHPGKMQDGSKKATKFA